MRRPTSTFSSFFGEGQKGDAASPLNRFSHIPLMGGAVPGNSSWNNLSPFRDEIPKQPGILVIDVVDLIGAEAAILLPLCKPASFHLYLLEPAWTCSNSY
jgi:hypothetical protein